MNSKVLKKAWAWFRSELFATFKEALQAAWNKYRLLAKLHTAVIEFRFVKADGSIRDAIGTLLSEHVSYQAKGSERKNNPLQVSFWDVERNAFRSVNVTRLLNIKIG